MKGLFDNKHIVPLQALGFVSRAQFYLNVRVIGEEQLDAFPYFLNRGCILREAQNRLSLINDAVIGT